MAIINGTASDDLGPDALIGTADDDIISGFAGSDELYGERGADILIGGPGGDRLQGSIRLPGIVAFFENDFDIASYETSAGPITVDLVNGIQNGDAFGDSYLSIEGFRATSASGDILRTGAGDQYLDGGVGADTMDGGDDDDTYVVDNVNDIVIEAAGFGFADTILTTLSTYTLSETVFVERLTYIGGGAFRGYGSSREDQITGGAGNDLLLGYGGRDFLFGGEGTDDLRGGTEDDFLYGEGGSDTLRGEAGLDTLDGGAGDDTLIGGADDDTYYVDSLGDIIVETSAGGFDTAYASSSYTLPNYVERLFSNTIDGVVLTGNSGANEIAGGNGNDTLRGLGGNDILGDQTIGGGGGGESFSAFGAGGLGGGFGFGGIDTLEGGTGNDLYYVKLGYDADTDTTGPDIVVELAGEGRDEVQTTVDGYVLPDNVEILTSLGIGLTLVGNDGDNTINGDFGDNIFRTGLGADIVNGNGGRDWIDYIDATGPIRVVLSKSWGFDADGTRDYLYGIANVAGSAFGDRLQGDDNNNIFVPGLGVDTVIGDGGTDTVDYSGASAGVTIKLYANAAFDDAGDRDGLSGIENATGSAFADLVYGSDVANELVGAEGADKLYGRAGGDTIYGDGLFGGPGGNDVIDGGLGSDSLFGGEGNDTLFAAAGVIELSINALNGEGGNDRLIGNAGNDFLSGGDGNDRFDFRLIYGSSFGVDRIMDLDAGDRIDLRGWGLAYSDLEFTPIGAYLYITTATWGAGNEIAVFGATTVSESQFLL